MELDHLDANHPTSDDAKDNIDNGITKKGINNIKTLHPILWEKSLNKKTKKNIYNTITEPVRAYESWVSVIEKEMEKKLLSTEITS